MGESVKKLPLPAVPRGLILRIRLELLCAQLRTDSRPHVVLPLVDGMMSDVEAHWQRRGVPSSPFSWCVHQYRQLYPQMRALRTNKSDPLPLVLALAHSALTKPTRLLLGLHLLAGAPVEQLAKLFSIDIYVCRARIRRGLRALSRILPTVLSLNMTQCLQRIEPILDLFWAIHQADVGHRYNRYILLRSLLNQLRHECEHAEVYAFLALIDYFHARLAALALSDSLQNENRTRWNLALVQSGNKHLQQATTLGVVGPFLLRAQIVQEQILAPTWDDIRWLHVAELYRKLELYTERDLVDYRDLSWGEALARNAEVSGGLNLLEQVRERVGENYALSYAKARLLSRMGKMKEAILVYQKALEQAPKRNKAAMLTQIAICNAQP